MSRLTHAIMVALATILLAWVPQAQARFMQQFQVIAMGAPAFQSSDDVKYAKYDLLDFARNRYNQIVKNGVYTYDLIRAINPSSVICIYEQGPDVWTGWGNDNGFDSCSVLDMNNIARYNVSRGHSMGNLNIDNPSLFLLKSSGGARCHTYGANYRYLMDFGSPSFINYWGEATNADLGFANVWHGDGIFIDNCAPQQSGYDCDTPYLYNTDATWSAAMMTWHTGIAASLHANGLKCWTNSGNLGQQSGYDFYTQIDTAATPPDIMSDEGVFVHGWGTAIATFYDETKWKRQVDIMTVMKHVKLAQFSHIRATEGSGGTDNSGQTLTWWDAAWYAMGSFCLGMNDQLKNDYLYFSSAQTGNTQLYWYDEYDRIDLGSAMGPYTVQTISGIHVYSREFSKGYVFVNLSAATTVTIPLAQACKQLTHATILQNPATFPDVTSISLGGHRAAFVLKSQLPLATVAARKVFYNNSAFDGNDANANAADDGAIATDKSALLPGQTGTFANYTSYSRGINGIMIDISGLSGTPTAADFSFKVGNDNTPSGWATAPAPTSITVRAGAGVGGSSRVTILWADGAITNKWLQVTALATSNTGLATQDVFYVGNAVGDTTGEGTLTPSDVVAVRNNAHTLALSPAVITDACDINRDRRVSPTDAILCRNNGGAALNLITVP